MFAYFDLPRSFKALCWFFVAFAQFGVSNNAFSQTPNTRVAVEKARDYLRQNGFDPSFFTGRPVDPKRDDPLIIEIAWASVRDGLGSVFEKELGLDRPPDISLYLIEKMICVEVTQRLRRIFPARSQVQKLVPEYRFAFVKPANACVELALKQLFRIDEEYFIPFVVFEARMELVASKDIRADYLTDGVLDMGKIGIALSKLAGRAGPLSIPGVAWEPVIRADDYAYVKSGWRPSSIRTGTKTDLFWAIKVGVKKTVLLNEPMWAIFAKVDVGARPTYENREDQIRTIQDPALQTQMLGAIEIQIIKNATAGSRQVISRPVDSTGRPTRPENSPVDPASLSNLHQLGQASLKQCRDLLCNR